LTNFIQLGLPRYLCAALTDIGYSEPTEIQEQSIPLLRCGHDLMGAAQTGSGKTAAYALPIIEHIDRCRAAEAQARGEGGGPIRVFTRALVLVPTRELALQVSGEFERFSKNFPLRVATIYGGTSYAAQLRALKKGCHVIVATPGRLLDHLERKTVSLANVQTLVLDEADRLMDMGFMPQVRRLVQQVPRERQTAMFSATISRRIEAVAAEFLKEPQVVRVNTDHLEPQEIEQSIINVDEFDKDALLLKMIRESDMSCVLVFTETRKKATWVMSRLREADVMAEELHSDIPQNKREQTLARFRGGKCQILVATDVAARGLDIPDISHVVNYDLPNNSEDYVHRIGRTGRAGRKGIAVSFVSKEQKFLLSDIQRMTGKQLDPNARPVTYVNGRKPSTFRTFRPRSGIRVG
jgi:ATP-dependent RNA helicase RhlE